MTNCDLSDILPVGPCPVHTVQAKLFGDMSAYSEIMVCSNPRKMKALGRKVKGFEEAAWDAARYDVVLQGNMHKFGPGSGLLREALLGTGDRLLVEASPLDRYGCSIAWRWAGCT